MVKPRKPPDTCSNGSPSMPFTWASMMIRKLAGSVRKLSPCQNRASDRLSSGSQDGSPMPLVPLAPRLRVIAKLSAV